jgi:hypothetical protein
MRTSAKEPPCGLNDIIFIWQSSIGLAMSRQKLNDRVIYIRRRARELAMSGRFERWQGIEFELRFVEGMREACALLAGAPVRYELDTLCQQARSTAPIETSIQSTLETLEELIAEYSAFQRGRPDLPQASVPDLSQDELELLVAAFQLHKAEQEVAEQIERSTQLH